MRKQYKIRWNDSDVANLQRAVRNFNAKVNRLKRALPQYKSSFPELVKTKDIKAIINTRRDLEREIRSLQRFTKRGAEKIIDVPGSEYNLKITKWQKSEMTRSLVYINRKRKERLDKILSMELTKGGKKLGYTKAQIGMGKPELLALEPMKPFYRTMDYGDLRERFKSIKAQRQSDFYSKRDYEVRENYIKGLKINYNYENVKDIIEHIKSISIEEFLEVFYEEGATFEEVSPPSLLLGIKLKESEYDAYETLLRTIWLPNKR